MSASEATELGLGGRPALKLGLPRLHLRVTDSTNNRARELATAGAPHGTLVTAAEQSAGRGRQGRTWSAPAGRALLCSLVVREPPRLLPLAAGVAVAEAVAVAVAEAAGREMVCAEAVRETVRAEAARAEAARAEAVRAEAVGARLKWPNDVLIGDRKVAGILVEGRPQERWAVLGIGVNVAVREDDFPPELRAQATTLSLAPEDIEATLTGLLAALSRWLAADEDEILSAVRERDALLGHPVRWTAGEGVGAGIDERGRLVICEAGGRRVALDAGEVHLLGPSSSSSTRD